MADTDVQVTFGADTAALTAGTTVAVGDINKIVQAIALLQKTVGEAARVTTSELTTAITGMGSQAGAQAPRVRQMAQEVERLSTAGHSGHGTIFGMQSGVFLELRALLDEALSGRMRNFEGSFARLLGMIGPNIVGFVALNPVISALGVAAAGSAGYLAYLAIEMYKVKEAQDTIARGTAFSGNFGVLDPKVLDDTRQKLEVLKGIFKGLGEDDVAKITVEFARMGSASDQVIAAMTADMVNVKDMWKAFGDKEEEASKNLVKAFSNPLGSVDAIGKAIGGINEKEREFILNAQRADNPLQAQAAIQQVIASHAANYHSARIAQIDAEIEADRNRQATTLAGDRQTRRMLQEHIDLMQREKDETQKIDANLAAMAGDISAAIPAAQNLEAVFRQLMHDSLPQVGELETVRLNIAKIKSDMANAGRGPDDNRVASGHMGELQAALDAQIAKERELQGVAAGGTAEEKVRTQNLQDQAAARGSNLIAAQRELDVAKQNLAAAKAEGGTATGPLIDKIYQAQIKVYEADYSAYKANEELKVKAAGKNSAEIIALRQAELTKAQSLFRSDSEQVKTAASELASAQEAAANRGAAAGAKAAKDQLGADRSAIEESLQLTKAENQEKIKDASDALSHHRISAAEYVATVKAALDAELSATREFYAQEEALANQSLTQKANLVRQEALEEKRIMNELTDAQRKAADEEQKSWDKVNSAFDSQVNGLLKGSENFRTAMKNIAASIIEAQIKTGLNSLLTGIEGIGGKALGIGGAGAGQSNGLITALMTALGLNTAATTAHTVATTTGTVAQVTGNAVSGVNTTGLLANTVSTDSNTIATNLAAIGHLFGFATGTPYVQQTGIAMIHAGERIVPANLNNPAGLASMLGDRPSGDSGSGGGSTSVSVSPQIHIHGQSLDGASVDAFWRNNRGDIARQLHQASREGALLGLRRLQR